MSILPLCDSHSFSHLSSCAAGARVPWASAFPPQPRSSDPVLPGLGPVCYSSNLSSGFKLLRSEVQQIQSSLSLLTYLFVPVTCQVFSSPTKPTRRSSALFRAGLTCASTNWGAALEGEQRLGASEGSQNNVWSRQDTIKECCPLMQNNWVPAAHRPCYSSSAACRKGLLELALSIWRWDTSDVWNGFALGLLNTCSMWLG